MKAYVQVYVEMQKGTHVYSPARKLNLEKVVSLCYSSVNKVEWQIERKQQMPEFMS